MIYLDNAATTQVAPEVLEAMLPYLVEEYGNANSLHALGRRARQAIQVARSHVANMINCDPENIVFTSGGTEANNMAILGVSDYLKSIGKTHIITSKIEHESVLSAVNSLIKCGFYITYITPDEYGCVSTKDIENAITEDTGLVSVMYVNNEIGSVNPVSEIGELCSERSILFHTDCVQAVGVSGVNLDVNKLSCDFLSLSAHKIHGAKGAGALYVRNPKILQSLIRGSRTQEFGLRGGTENVAGIVGFGKACELSYQSETESQRLLKLRSNFLNAIETYAIECNLENKLHINEANMPTKILNIRFDGVDNESLILLLESKDVYVSAGSACHDHISEPSHVLKAVGLSDEEARNSIRVSFSSMSTTDDVINAAKIIIDCVNVLSLHKEM